MGKPLTDIPARDRLTATHRAKLRKLVDEHGAPRVAQAANVGVETIARAVADLPMRPSSVTAIVSFLEAQ
jgi:hypothetical protein